MHKSLMKKQSLLLIALLLTGSIAANAQLKRFSIGPYVEAGFPVGNDFNETNKSGWGVGLNADIKLVAGFGVTGSVGYMRFAGKAWPRAEDLPTGEYPTVAAVPVRVGLKYKLVSILYLKLEGGTATYTGDMEGTSFLLAPGVGIRVLGLDVQAKYENWFNGGFGFTGLKASFNF
ncbi:outer membrane beta-barrel protein [Chitinophaga lutea]